MTAWIVTFWRRAFRKKIKKKLGKKLQSVTYLEIVQAEVKAPISNWKFIYN